MPSVKFPAKDAEGVVHLLDVEVENDTANLYPVFRFLGRQVSDLKVLGLVTARGVVQVPVSQVSAVLTRLKIRGARHIPWLHCCEHLQAALTHQAVQVEPAPVPLLAPSPAPTQPAPQIAVAQPAPAELLLHDMTPEAHLRKDLSLLGVTPHQINRVLATDRLHLVQDTPTFVLPGMTAAGGHKPTVSLHTWYALRDSYEPGILRTRQDFQLNQQRLAQL